MAKTGAGTHRATQRGYAAGQLIEEGDAVPEGIAVSEVWMEKVKGSDKGMAERFDEVQDSKKDDPALDSLSIAALQLRATEAGVTDVTGLKKADLISLINAERDRRTR
jgi:hypothetical protein